MKIVHISTFDVGGAPLCMLRIHNAIKKQGVKSDILVSEKTKENPDVHFIERDSYEWSTNRFVRAFQVLGCRMLVWPSLARYYSSIVNKLPRYVGTLFAVPLTEYTRLAQHPLIKEADIVHLHWVSNFIDYPTFFKSIHKPIVWTVHDLNPGMGGYHYYPTEDQKLHFDHLERRFLKIKARAMKNANIHLVAISKFMMDYCRANEVLKNFPTTLIYNGIDENVFQLLDKSAARRSLNIDDTQRVFMFSCCNISDERKGLTCLVSVLEKLQIPNCVLLCIGRYETKLPANIPIRYMGYVMPDSKLLSELYSAADYFILPSYQETYAQTAVEAAMCGTPVIGFPCGIMPELITEQNGVCCPDYTEDSLAKAIQIGLSRTYDRKAIRQDAKSRFSIEEVASQYITLYQSLL